MVWSEYGRVYDGFDKVDYEEGDGEGEHLSRIYGIESDLQGNCLNQDLQD